MIPMCDMRPFEKGLHQLSVVTTDLAEAESLIQALAEEEKKRSPGSFVGKSPCVYFKLPYIPPCEPFKELRKLILRIRKSTGLRANFRGAIAIEASEWVGHEREEYFTVLLKYLYDHRAFWKMAVILNRCTGNQIDRFLSSCSRYITPRLFVIRVFQDDGWLCNLVRSEFSLQNCKITREAARLLSAALVRKELEDARSLSLIERAVGEVVYMCGHKKAASVETIREYLLDPCSTLAMMAGMPLFDERSVALEEKTL